MSIRNAMLDALDIAIMELDNYNRLQLVKPMVSVQFAKNNREYLYLCIYDLTVGDLVLVPVFATLPLQVAVVTRIWFYKPDQFEENRPYKTVFQKVEYE